MKILSLFSGFLALPVIVGTLPNNILNGQVEDAVPVMGNFNYIVNQINANGAARGVNSDITQLNGLVVPLSVGQGGTGGQTATATFNTGSVTLPSAATVNIGAATSPNINISGAATISAFDNYPEGALRFITYTGTATITYNAVTMQLIKQASRTNAVGDFSVFRSLGAGNWREELYQPANGSILGNAPTATTSSDLNGAPTFFSPLTNSLAADVALNNIALFFDGPSVAQGASGKWFVSGNVVLLDSVNNGVYWIRLWDGTTIIDEGAANVVGGGLNVNIHLSGYISNPTGNLRISVRDPNFTTAVIRADATGLGTKKSSTITAFRIG